MGTAQGKGEKSKAGSRRGDREQRDSHRSSEHSHREARESHRTDTSVGSARDSIGSGKSVDPRESPGRSARDDSKENSNRVSSINYDGSQAGPVTVGTDASVAYNNSNSSDRGGNNGSNNGGVQVGTTASASSSKDRGGNKSGSPTMETNAESKSGSEGSKSKDSSDTAPASSSTIANATAKQTKEVPVVFTWTHGGQNVFLIGSFNNWSEKLPMVRSGLEFHVVVNLTRQEHQYKFIADDQWRYSSDYPIVSDDLGNIHNVMDVSQYEAYDLFKIAEQERQDLPFSQLAPNFAEYATEPPTIPVVLAKSAFVAVDPPVLKMPPNIPLHCIVSHFFHDYGRTLRHRLRRRVKTADQSDSDSSMSKKGDVLCIGMTHRFERTYTTSILVTHGDRWPRPASNLGGGSSTIGMGSSLLNDWRYYRSCNPLELCFKFDVQSQGASISSAQPGSSSSSGPPGGGGQSGRDQPPTSKDSPGSSASSRALQLEAMEWA
ncbi:unnamed protein product [Amoebophrya sp. A25]|nr:unnamed protein product [Amoebophrya sp. A25]|eukprot:GSA25T00026023001.1